MIVPTTTMNPLPASVPEPRSNAAEAAKSVAAEAAQAAMAGPAPPSAEPSRQELAAAVDSLNRSMEPANHNLKFRIDDGTERVVVSVLDKETGETVRQIPPKEVLAIAESIERYQKGLLLSQQA